MLRKELLQNKLPSSENIHTVLYKPNFYYSAIYGSKILYAVISALFFLKTYVDISVFPNDTV